jgi:hypothetical protein
MQEIITTDRQIDRQFNNNKDRQTERKQFSNFIDTPKNTIMDRKH